MTFSRFFGQNPQGKRSGKRRRKKKKPPRYCVVLPHPATRGNASLTSREQIEDISKRLQDAKYDDISQELVRYALNSKFAAGDVDKAVELLQLQRRAFAGIIEPYNPNTEMVGAENRGAVTCYLDALLFAMFANLTAFECMLENDPADEPKRRLAALIRLWVNMLRTGKLIHTDMVCVNEKFV